MGKNIRALLSVLAVSAALTACKPPPPPPKEVFKDGNITVTLPSLGKNLLNFHDFEALTANVGGKSHLGLVGTKPFYLIVPGQNSLVFVTQNPPPHGPATLHVLNRTSNVTLDIGLPLEAAAFGRRIGETADADEVTSPDPRHLVLRTNSGNYSLLIGINLPDRRAEWAREFHYGNTGAIIATKELPLPGLPGVGPDSR